MDPTAVILLIISPVRRYLCLLAILIVETKHHAMLFVHNLFDRVHTLKLSEVLTLVRTSFVCGGEHFLWQMTIVLVAQTWLWSTKNIVDRVEEHRTHLHNRGTKKSQCVYVVREYIVTDLPNGNLPELTRRLGTQWKQT